MQLKRTRVRGLSALLLMICALPLPALAADWTQWRGPARTGESEGPAWPTTLENLEPIWTKPLGKGYPGPIISGDRVFVVESTASEAASVRALSRETGESLWQTQWEAGADVPFFARANGDWVRSTPAFDGRRLFVGDMNEVIVALDAKDGSEVWRIDFPARYESRKPDFGYSSSPLLDKGFLYLQVADSLVKVDGKTGEVVWRVMERDTDIMNEGAFSSPIIATLHGKRQLLVQTRETLLGIALKDGAVLWSHDVPSFRGMNILTPTVHGDQVFTSTYKNKSFMYQIAAAEGSMTASEAWTHKAAAYMSSPVVIDGHAYMHLGNGRISCINLDTGEETWRSQESFGKYWSMVYRDDKILALDETGELILMKANPETFQVLSRKEVTQSSAWGYLAVAGDEVFVRELEGITAFKWPADSAKKAGP